MDDEYKDSVMIALLPVGSNWCKIDLPHMTLVYAGKIGDHDPADFNKMAKDASSLAVMNRPITLMVSEVEVLGEEEKVDVLSFRSTSELESMRHMVEGWNDGEYPNFKPHATMGPVGTRMLVQQQIPEYVTFDRVYVGWGEQCLTFLMKVAGY